MGRKKKTEGAAPPRDSADVSRVVEASAEAAEALRAFQEHVETLREKAVYKERWGAAHSRDARGELSGLWMTPSDALEEIQTVVRALGMPCTFVLDVAAAPGSAVCTDWFGPFHILKDRRDALVEGISWGSSRPGISYLNPPYKIIAKFLAKAAKHKSPLDENGVAINPLVVLGFARTGTRWWWSHVAGKGLTFLREGRLKFVDPLTGRPSAPAPADSFISIYTGQDPETILERAPGDVRKIGRWHLGRF